MNPGVLLDTSFLIHFVDKKQPYHHSARRYYGFAMDNRIALHLSPLAVAEFSRQQDIASLPLRRLLPAPLAAPEGELAGKIANLVNKNKTTDDKQRVSVDIMLIAQAEFIPGVVGILTSDTSTLVKYSALARAAGLTKRGTVDLCQGFESKWLTDPFYVPPTPKPKPPAVGVHLPTTPAPLI